MAISGHARAVKPFFLFHSWCSIGGGLARRAIGCSIKIPTDEQFKNKDVMSYLSDEGWRLSEGARLRAAYDFFGGNGCQV